MEKKVLHKELEEMKNAKDVGYIGEPLLTKLLKVHTLTLKGSFVTIFNWKLIWMLK
jgi:hypothetical protein